jgi:hypothetical protein
MSNQFFSRKFAVEVEQIGIAVVVEERVKRNQVIAVEQVHIDAVMIDPLITL